MTNKEQIRAIEKWQNESLLPLTCGNNSKHNKLIPIEKNGKVILRCPDCEYTQEYIPK